MSDPSSLAASACKPPENNIPFSEMVQNNIGFLKSLGLNHCVTDSLDTSQSESVSINAFIESGSREQKSTYAHKATNGCSAISALLQTYNNTVSKVQCMIKESTVNESLSSSSVNSVLFKAGKDINIDCPDFTITQTIGSKIINITKIDEKTLSDITDSVQNSVNSFTDQLKNMYEGNSSNYGPDGQGTEAINNIFSSKVQNTIRNQVAKTVAGLSHKFTNENEVTIEAGGSIFIDADHCMIDQDILSYIYAGSIVSDVFKEVFSEDVLPSLIPPLPYTPPDTSSKTMLYVALAVVILLLFGAGYYYYFIRKTGGKKKST
jgi:hypothetical protein